MTRQRSHKGLADYTRRQGGAAIGARLRRLSERIDREVAEIYAQAGVRFEQRWFGVLNLLDRNGPLSVGELATPLGVSHVSISQTRQALEKAGLIRLQTDPNDARSRLIHPTAKGRELIARLRPTWKRLAKVAVELNAEAGDVVAALERLEAALTRRSMQERVADLTRSRRPDAHS